jgi:hypothetical protein
MYFLSLKSGWLESMDKILGAVRGFLPEFVLLVVFGLLMVLNVGAFDIDPYSELFHIQAARESLAAGRFWIPVINGADYLIRPPLWTWIDIITFKLLGVSLWAARLPAILCSVLTLAFTYLMTLQLTQSRFSAFFAAAILGSTWGFFHLGSLSTAETLAATLFTGFLWAFLQWHSFARRKTTIAIEMDTFSAILGVLLGILLLLKGALSFVLLWLIVITYLILNRSVSLVQKLNWGLLLGPMILIPLPWTIWVSIHTKNSFFIADYLVTMPLERWLGLGPWKQLRTDWLFYLKRLPVDLMPYILLIPGALLENGLVSRRGGSANTNTPWLMWLCVWFLLGLVAYSFSVFQEPTLLLPYFPPIAILAGYYLGQVMESSSAERETTYGNTLIAYILVLMTGAVIGSILIFQIIPSNYVAGFWHFPGQSVIEFFQLGEHRLDLPEAFPLWKFWLVPGPFILLIGGFALFLLQAERRLSATPFALLITFFVFMLFVNAVYMPIMHRPVSEQFARQINRQVQSGDQVVLYSLHPDVKRVLFYLDRDKLPRTRMVRKPELIQQSLKSEQGSLYGVIRENSFFHELPFDARDLLQVNAFNWKWDMGRMSEMRKLLVVRQPHFDKMRSNLIYFKSLSPLTLQALREAEQPVIMIEEKSRRRRR